MNIIASNDRFMRDDHMCHYSFLCAKEMQIKKKTSFIPILIELSKEVSGDERGGERIVGEEWSDLGDFSQFAVTETEESERVKVEEKSRRGENTELGFDPFRARDTLNRTVWVKVTPRVASMCSRTRQSHETSA